MAPPRYLGNSRWRRHNGPTQAMKKASAYDFASVVDRQIEELPGDVYLRRLGRAKQLVEELYPLSRLAIHFKQPGLEVEVEGFEDDGRSDGSIAIRGFREREIEVQITYAGFSYDEALRAELLVSEGACPGAGEIQRERKSGGITARMGGVDHGEHVTRIASAVVDRFRDKATKPYDHGTVLLIAFHDVKLSGQRDWEQVLSAVKDEIRKTVAPFIEIYLFNGATNELRRAA